VQIGPRGSGEASGVDSEVQANYVFLARGLKAAYLHVQVGVAEVDFADGTKWRPQTELRPTLLDPSLVAADEGKCPDVAGVIEALKSIHVVELAHKGRKTRSQVHRTDKPNEFESLVLLNRVCAHQPNDHVADTIENLTNRGARQPCSSSDRATHLFDERSLW
jgi:hypothetical protein